MAWRAVFGSLLLCLLLAGWSYAESDMKKAICNVSPADSSTAQQIKGQILLSQKKDGTGPTTVEVSLSGFEINDEYKKHGFHVHESSSIGSACVDAGGHYNPDGVVHGGPTDAIRHVGDLGNVEEDANGKVETTITDNIISLSGDRSIIGRTIVIHAKEDDLNKGGAPDSNTTGNAGGRLACCIIEESIVATCDIDASSGNEVPVTGTVRLSQKADGTGPTTLNINLSGFQDEDDNQAHGFHIHMTGDTGNKCLAAGGHYNPDNKNHGAPEDAIRHVGDLGNIDVRDQAVSTIITDDIVKLSGDDSVIGKAIVVHALMDDLGKGGNDESLMTGNAGARLGCCVIKVDDDTNFGTQTLASTGLLFSVFITYLILAL